MRPWFSAAACAVCAALSALATAPRTASAAPKNKPHAAATRKPNPKNLNRAAAPAAPQSKGAQVDAAASADESAQDKQNKGDSSGAKAAGPSAAQAAAPTAAAPAAQATVQEDKAGVKTYKFATVEVEGRMKSPQIIYFLRRVRAEFDAGALGHRSFMRELSDTRNNSALR